MADMNQDALEIWNALKPMIDKEIESKTRGMVQRRQARVTTAPNSGTHKVGVTEPFGRGEYFIPFLPGVANASVGDIVWTEFMYGATNSFASMFANIYDTQGGDALSQTVAALLMSILNAGTYNPSQNANLAALAALIITITWNQTGATLVGTGSPDITSITQSGTTLALS